LRHPTPSETLKYEYLLRVNRAIDYVHNNYAEDLNLTKLAKIACFSPFHFHRLFRLMTGETVNEFVRRIRMEKSAYKISANQNYSITEIALECGFSSSQNFARAFKTYYGYKPSFSRKKYTWESWKNLMTNRESMDPTQISERGAAVYDFYCSKLQQPIKDILNTKKPMAITVTQMPSYRVAYVRCQGPYTAETATPAWKRLLQWANPKGLVNENNLPMGIHWSKPEVTPENKFIYDACIALPEGMKTGNEINIQYLHGGLCAIYHCEIASNEFYDAWMALLLNWLTASDYQPDDRPTREIFYNDPETHPLKHCIVDLCLPVKPLHE